jgi:hypothetical protein
MPVTRSVYVWVALTLRTVLREARERDRKKP